MISTTDAAKVFDKIKYPKKLGVGGSCLDIIETAYNKPQPTYQMGKKLKAFPIKISNETVCTLCTLVEH